MQFSKVVVLKYEPRKLVPMKSQSAKEQYEVFNRPHSSYEEDFHERIDYLLGELEDEDCLVITGSLYFISDVRKSLMK